MNRLRQAMALLSPALLFVLLLALYPLLQVLRLSIAKEPGAWLGSSGVSLENYAALFHDPTFWAASWHSVLYVVGSAGLHLGLGAAISLALFLLRDVRGIGILRTFIILPWAVTPAVAAMLWRLIYHPELSIVPNLLAHLGLSVPWNWLGDPRMALLAVVIANAWLFTPFYMLMMLARLQATPLELIDAATVDGATWREVSTLVLLPSLRSLLLTLGAFDVIGTFVQFDMVWVMTGGGPLGSTEVLSTYVYRLAFESFDFGKASAAGIALLVLLAASAGLLLSRAGEKLA